MRVPLLMFQIATRSPGMMSVRSSRSSIDADAADVIDVGAGDERGESWT